MAVWIRKYQRQVVNLSFSENYYFEKVWLIGSLERIIILVSGGSLYTIISNMAFLSE